MEQLLQEQQKNLLIMDLDIINLGTIIINYTLLNSMI